MRLVSFSQQLVEVVVRKHGTLTALRRTARPVLSTESEQRHASNEQHRRATFAALH
ncbi:MAG: hypothetical protein OEZ06_26275 [Myxococcales bacterium]|nr:hypothetical protein [Myxococcales bacterium]